MKKAIFIVAILLTALAIPAFAQQPGDLGPMLGNGGKVIDGRRGGLRAGSVRPNGPGCYMGVNPTNATIPASGGTFSFTIDDIDQCGWSASSNVVWITLGQTSGFGTTVVSYTVEANTGGPRSGVIDVQGYFYGLTLTVDQPASPVTITVTNPNDSGPGSLRQAIADATPESMINFDDSVFGTPQTITLTSGQLVIDKNLTINGPGAGLLAISGSNASRVFYINGGVTAALDGITIRGGSVNEAGGGGIYNLGILTVTNCTIAGNETFYNGSGGGILNNGTLTVAYSTISGNHGDGDGGGILNYGSLTVADSTISGNSADDQGSGGGGIYNISLSGSLTIINSTIFGNTAYIGGGIGAFANERLINTIVAGNTSPIGSDMFPTIEIANNNLIGDAASSGGIQNGVNGNIVGFSPLLGPLANNGGPTMTHALLTGSPALNAGDNCVLVENGCGYVHPALPTDQRGFLRIGNVDMGAFESGVWPCNSRRRVGFPVPNCG
jgi:hypothetical protein